MIGFVMGQNIFEYRSEILLKFVIEKSCWNGVYKVIFNYSMFFQSVMTFDKIQSCGCLSRFLELLMFEELFIIGSQGF